MDLAWKIAFDNYQKNFALYPGSARMMQADTQLEIQRMHEELGALKKPKFALSVALNVLLLIGYIVGSIVFILYVPWPLNAIFSIVYAVLWVVLSDAFYLLFKKSVREIIGRRRVQILASHQILSRPMIIYAGKIYFEMIFVPHSLNHNFNYPNVVPIIVDRFNAPGGVPAQGYPMSAPAPIPEIHLTPAPLPEVSLPAEASPASFYQPPRNAPLYAEMSAPRSAEPRATAEHEFVPLPSGAEWPQGLDHYEELKTPPKGP